MIILQGIPSILMGLVALFFLPDRPDMTKFLDEDERKIAVARMNRGVSGDKGLVLNRCKRYLCRFDKSNTNDISIAHISAALTDWRVSALVFST